MAERPGVAGDDPDRATEEQVARVRALLEKEGIIGEVEVVGRDGDIVAVMAERTALPGLRTLAPEIRSLGFRYVTLDLTRHAD
ncbi:MAG TPA: hypothetical protein VK966_03510 [Longimicrobiales bacterium]|nr:hypothetical protein [Longimicrobiales bacterium]